MPAHKHAALMLQYAQDAAETDKPWERWEAKRSRQPEAYPWVQVKEQQGMWNVDFDYRRKPRTIRIGEFDVPEPLREAPAIGAYAWWPGFAMLDSLAACFMWRGGTDEYEMLRRGVVHTTKEAAELHAKALISLTERKE